ncbi:hypothetical protein OEA41_004794 [Lepraria neglecta]|uniref:Amidohydrolase n=1 Tax=Lepraria neglecta TaxID=209136 RepID=A0AAD9Z0Y7_9LECA|nr:hypothetical protein OEA41_004794 [Lepraria neglecta]
MDKRTITDDHRPRLPPFEEIYKDLHQNPELSRQKVRTASIVASHLDALHDFIVYRNIGGHGVVDVLHNGSGPTVLLRADMDALPHLEATGLPYASTKTAKNAEGETTPVMHACGHDMHTATLMPPQTEEIAYGEKSMVADGLYEKVSIPDTVIGQYIHAIKAGVVALSGGPVLTAVDSFEIRIYGESGHVSRPDLCVDPVITAAHIVVHELLIAAVKRLVRAECEASGSLVVREQEFKTMMHTPATISDIHNAAILKAQFKEYFRGNAIDKDPFGASEDFSPLSTACWALYVFYMWGYVNKETWDEAEREGKIRSIPHNYSTFFAPVIQPTLMGVDAFSVAALTFLGEGSDT